jgi:LemA protein
MAGWVILGILVVVVFMLAGTYNQLVQLGVRTDSAWSDIDVQLTRRRDLIPDLVETMKRYAAREQDRLEDLAKCRSLAVEASTPADKAQAENQLTGALKNLLAVAENYPDLKTNQKFIEIEASLGQTEDAIQSARRFYNALVRDLNTRIQSFPSNILARTVGLDERQFFDIRAADREPVPVKL